MFYTRLIPEEQLIGGNEQDDDRWYEVYIPIAGKLYQEHLEELKKEEML